MFANFSSGITTNFELMKTDIREDMKQMNTKVEEISSDLRSQIDCVSEDLRALDHRTRTDAEKLERRLRDLENRQVDGQATTREEAEYWKARKSLRICPVRGPDLMNSLSDFLTGKLGLDKSIMDRLTDRSIRKLPTRKQGKFSEEAVVVFDSVSDRDMVKSSAYHLAGQKDASIRLELPAHLLSQHRMLSSAAQSLRKAREGCKTNLRFDDDTMKLVLDYKVKDSPWARLRPEQARGVVAPADIGIQETSTEDFSKLLENPSTGANSIPL
jgi:hypothetical protein